LILLFFLIFFTHFHESSTSLQIVGFFDLIIPAFISFFNIILHFLASSAHFLAFAQKISCRFS